MEAFVKKFSESGVPLTWVFIVPSLSCDRISKKYNGVNIRYLWQDRWAKNRILKRINMHFAYLKFLLSLKKDDVVYIYGCAAFAKFLVKRSVRVYHEVTENPEAVSWPAKFSFPDYYDACSKMEGMFVISEPLKEHYLNKGCDPVKVQILNMTVDPTRFEGVKKQKVADKYIAYCGTASNNKDGVDELIKSFAIASKKYPEYKLYIIGNTPSKDDAVGNLKLIEQLDIKEKVVFTGIVSSSEMPQILMNADILALGRPDSLQAKCGFPTKLGEYLLTGNPVFITKTGDIPKFLEDGKSALLCQERNPKEFSSKLIWAIEHPLEASAIGLRGKQVALDNFNASIEFKKLLNTIF